MVDGAQSGEMAVLEQLRQKNPDITAAVVATMDGFAVHSDDAGAVDPDTLAAMAADLANRAASMTEDLDQGALGQILIAAEGGYVVATKIADEFCLAVAAKNDASLGLLMINVRKAAGQLAEEI